MRLAHPPPSPPRGVVTVLLNQRTGPALVRPVGIQEGAAAASLDSEGVVEGAPHGPQIRRLFWKLGPPHLSP